MSENKEMQVQRLKAIEKQGSVTEKTKRIWQDAKDNLAQARKAYEKQIEGLCNMIREKSDTPLFDTKDEEEE